MLIVYLDQKQPASKRDVGWWVVFLGLNRFASKICKVVTRLQGLTMLLGEQKVQLKALIVTLRKHCPVVGPHDFNTLTQLGPDVGLQVVRGAFSAKLADAHLFLNHLGSFVIGQVDISTRCHSSSLYQALQFQSHCWAGWRR